MNGIGNSFNNVPQNLDTRIGDSIRPGFKKPNISEQMETFVQSGVDSLADKYIDNKKLAKKVAQYAGAVPSGAAAALGIVADRLDKNSDIIATNTETRIENVKSKLHSHSDSALKTGIAVAGSIVGGVIGTVADTAAGVLDVQSGVTGFVKKAAISSVDNLEGTKRKSIPKYQSLAANVDKRVEKMTQGIKKGSGVVSGTTLAVIGAVGGALAETVAEVMDVGKLVYARMNDRAVADGVGYKYEKKQAWAEYEASDKGIKDKVKLAAKRTKQTVEKIGDVRVGDLLRIGDAVTSMPKRMTINTLNNIGDVFK